MINITAENINKIIRCKDDVNYFAELCGYTLTDAQKAIVSGESRLLRRQQGKTLAIAIKLAHLYLFSQNLNVIFLARKMDMLNYGVKDKAAEIIFNFCGDAVKWTASNSYVTLNNTHIQFTSNVDFFRGRRPDLVVVEEYHYIDSRDHHKLEEILNVLEQTGTKLLLT